MAVLDCDKDTLLAAYPCINCLSDQQVLALIAIVLCKGNAQDANADCSASTLLASAACMTCLSESQMLKAIAALLGNSAVDAGYIEWGDALTAQIACMLCLNKKQLLAIILNLICEGVAAGTLLCDGRQ